MKNIRSKEDLTKLVLFDVDQTLVNVFDFHEQTFQKTFKDLFNINASFFDIDFEGKLLSNIAKEVAQKHNIELTEENISEFLKNYEANFFRTLPDRIELLPGVKILLEKLSKEHILGIVTGNTKKVGETILKRAGIYDKFEVFVYGDEANNRNELVKKAIEKADEYAFNEVVVVGDSVHDIESARANNAKVISVNTGHHSEEKLLEQKPELFVKTLEDKRVLEFLG